MQSVIEALRTGNPSLARRRFEKLPPQYAENPENVIREGTKILRSDTRTLQALFRLVAANKKTGSLPDLALNFLEYQRSEGELDSIEDLINGVRIIAQVLNGSTEAATKESEEKLVQLILSTLLKTLPSENYEKWEEVETWLGNDFYRIFKSLKKTDILRNVVQTFENSGAVNLERYQLEYIEKRYYYCADSKAILDPESGEPESYFNFTECNKILETSSKKIVSSLSQDVINESKGENSTATDVIQYRVLSVVSDYPTLGPGQDENARPYSSTINDNNLWLTYVLDAVFNAVQNGSIPFDPSSGGKLFRILSPLKSSLSKYPVLTEHVTKTVNNIYKRTKSDIHPVMGYIADLPDSLERLATTTLVSLLSQNKPKLPGDQTVILARQMALMGLKNEELWNSIPEQSKLLATLTDRTVLKWTVKVASETYDIYGKADGTIGLRKESGSSKSSSSGLVWAFRGRFSEGTTVEVSLIDPNTEQYGNLAYLRREGLKHELRSKRRSGNYAFFINLTEDQNAFNLRYVTAKLPICILRDEVNIPVGLGSCNEESIEPANFVVASDTNDYKQLLQKLF